MHIVMVNKKYRKSTPEKWAETAMKFCDGLAVIAVMLDDTKV